MGNNLKNSRIGERKLTKTSGWMEIIEYNIRIILKPHIVKPLAESDM